MNTYTVIGKRGYGATRVEWEFAPIDLGSCLQTARIYGSTIGADPLVTTEPVTLENPASVEAVRCLHATADHRTVRIQEQS